MSKHGQFAIIPARALDDTRFDKNERYLRALLILGTYADRDGWCYPGLKLISERLGVTRPTASKTMQDLADWGYLMIVHRPGKDGEGNQSNMYRIIHDAELPVKFARENEKHPVKSASAEEIHPVKNPLVEISNNVPLNVPFNDTANAENSKPDQQTAYPQGKERVLKDPMQYAVDYHAKMNAPKSSPQAEQKQFIKEYAPRIASILLHAEPSDTDKSATRKIFEKKYPRDWLDDRLAHYSNGQGEQFRKADATAYWVTNKLSEDWANRNKSTSNETDRQRNSIPLFQV